MTTSAQQPVRRPGAVSIVAVILYVQAFLAAITAVSLLIWRSEILDFLDREGSPMSGGVFNGTIVGETITAVLLLVVAGGLMRGSNSIRLFVAVVQFLTMAFALYVLVAHHVGGYVFRAVFSLFVGVFVLWSLYGNDESDRFFEANERKEPRTTTSTIWGPADPMSD